MQTRASFKKEILAFLRTNKFLTIAIVMIGMAILAPMLYVGLESLLTAMNPIYEQMGMDISGMTGMLGASTVFTGVFAGITNLAQVGLIVYLLLINSFAGGEQKKRSVIIPSSSGLRNFSYIFPKFIVYPLAALLLALIGAFVSWGVSAAIYEVGDVSPVGVLLGGALAGVCLMFYVCCHLALGTATGKPGMSAAVCISAALLLPDIFTFADPSLVYNPFTLSYLAGNVVQEGALRQFPPLDILMTVLITLVIMVILYFVALFVQNAKKVDNSGNEIRL